MTITKEGALASFYTVNKAPIKHLRVYFSSKQEGSGDPSPENVRPIDGWDNIDIYTAGKNLIRFPLMTRTVNGITWTTHTNGSISVDGLANSQYAFMSNWRDENEHIDFYLKAGTYKLSGNNSNIGNIYFVARDGSTTKDIGSLASNSTFSTFTLTQDTLVGFLAAVRQVDGEIHTTFYPQLELIEVSKYEAPHYNTFSLDWSNDIGTIYGGYVDLITGELILTHMSMILNGSESFGYGVSGTGRRLYTSLGYPGIKPASDGSIKMDVYCNKLPTTTDALSYYSPYTIGVSIQSNGVFNIGFTSEPITKELGLNWLAENPILIVFPLKNPITHQLTSRELQTFIGQNNIWSNADRIEVEYNLAESNDELYRRRNIILLSAPHLESASGNIANFSTDIVAPIKEAKIYFNPILEGSGDPSPENIRNINGWTGLSINQTGKNLLDPVIAFTTQGGADPTEHVNSDGSVTVTVRDGTSWIARGYLDLPPGTYYFCSEFGSGYNSRYIINDVNSTETNFNGKKTITITEPTRFRFKVAMGTEYPVTGWLLVFNTDDTYGEFPYINNILNITWESNSIIYGGYVDLITGETYSKYSKLNLSNIAWSNFSGHKIHFASVLERPANGLIFSNMLTPKINTIAPGQTGIGYYNDRDNERKRIYVLKDEAVANDTEFRTWFAETYPDAYIVYELETPQLITTLTPQQLTALKGVNNIWSDTNGPIEIQYWTH